MENNRDNNSFQYTYSAKQQAELKKIREKYTAGTEEEDKMARLRRLDNGVTQKATVASLVFGIIGTLILGLGMSLAMSDFSEVLGMQREMAFVLGIVIGVVGAILLSFAYPIYNWVMKRERKKVASEILRLTDELLK